MTEENKKSYNNVEKQTSYQLS